MSDAITREARRVAAAFGVEEWEVEPYTTIAGNFFRVGGWLLNRRAVAFEAKFTETGELFSVSLDNPDLDFVAIGCHPPDNDWEVFSYEEGDFDLMARGLYRLDFPDSVLAQLPPLSSHEKLEMRLSLPRHFWPASWLAEAQNMTEVDVS